MKLTHFIQYASNELSTVRHPYSSVLFQIPQIEHRVRVVDLVLRKGTGTYEALAENVYEALGQYLYAPRQHRALIRGSLERLAVHFEGFLRTAVSGLVPTRDVELFRRDKVSRGLLSQQGYMGDVLEHLCQYKIPTTKRSPEKLALITLEESVYTECFKFQQRAKHEARNYTLSELEELAVTVLAAYILFSGWLLANTEVGDMVRLRAAPSSREAVLRWPEILEFQLGELRLGEDADLEEDRERLIAWSQELQARADELDARLERTEEDPEFDDFRLQVVMCSEEYEHLVSESNMRDWGREAQYSDYI